MFFIILTYIIIATIVINWNTTEFSPNKNTTKEFVYKNGVKSSNFSKAHKKFKYIKGIIHIILSGYYSSIAP